MVKRRAFLKLAVSSGFAIATVAGRSALAAPPIIQAAITPQQFGARGGDAIADTRGWNAAVETAAGTGRPVVARGTYVLRVPSSSKWNWGALPAKTHVAVQLLSGTHIEGKDAQIVVGRPESLPSDRLDRHFLFGTGGNTHLGAVRDISFDGLTFDFRDELGPVHPFTYAIGVTGVDDLVRRNLMMRSSGTRAGRGLLADNIRRRHDENIRHANIVQGTYTRYEYGVSARHIEFDGFVEAMDFDGPCWDVAMDDLTFKNGFGEAQCIDTAGGAHWLITNVKAENVSSIIYIYFKSDSRPTYEQWLEAGGARAVEYVRPEDFTVRGVQMDDPKHRKSGKHPYSLRVGNIRNERSRERVPYAGGPKNIVIEDWSQKGGGQIVVSDCENLTMRRLDISDISTPDDVETGAAIVLREPDAGIGGKVTGTVSDVVVRNSQGMGLTAVGGRALSLNSISVDTFNRGRGSVTNAAIRLRPSKGSIAGPILGAFHVTGGPSGATDLDR